MKKLLYIVLLLCAPLSWAANKQVTIDIDQMTCSLCVISVNQALRSTEGVIKAKSSLKTRQAVAVVPERFDNQKLLAAVAKTGYTGKISSVTDIN